MPIQSRFEVLEKALASGEPIIPTLKQAIIDYKDSLEARFHEGENLEILLTDHGSFIDMILTLVWRQFDWQQNLNSWFKSRISLVAVGGYGRGELHPHSDIDLLILLEKNSYDKHKINIQSFTTLLWDIGLEVGHSVRSIKECKSQAKADVTVMTALLEGRTVVGDDDLFQKVNELTSARNMWSEEKFYRAKLAEHNERHKKFEHTEYSLEPNVKSSPGGLRDIQTVMWIARRKYGKVNFDDLVDLNFLTSGERDILRAGERLLWKIRYGLHLITDKEDDRLLFENQRKLAEMFGYQDSDQLAVEQFMQAYYRTAMMISATTEMLLQHFDEAIIQAGGRARITPINERFQIRNDYIEAIHPDVFVQHPAALMEIFLHIGTLPIEGTRAETIRLIRQHLYLINDDFRANEEVTELFMSILRDSQKLSSQLVRMERYGILGSYLPEFGRVVGQMQFDLFHIYTVDAHTLQVVKNMRRFRYRNNEQKYPVAAHIFGKLPKVELLYIAGLYHDIAKGMGGDHSELGMGIAEDFCKRHGLGTWDTNLVIWLVENHLIMSSTAQRKDISDPEVIHEFARLVKDQVRLDYLYTLTVADINATNPTLWNSWRASLMRQLYVETKKALRHGLETIVDRSEYVTEIQNHAIARLSEHDYSREEILKIWGNVDEDYFIRESVSDIVWQTSAIAEHKNKKEPLILIRDTTSKRDEEGATQIFVYTTPIENFFATIVNSLDVLNLDVVDARIARGEEWLFSSFFVLESNGQPVGPNESRKEEILKLLKKAYENNAEIKPHSNRRTPRLLKPFTFKTEVTISQDEMHDLTVLEIITPDRPGLLAIVANIFSDMDLRVQNAKITTLGERVEDVFNITDSQMNPVTDPETLKKLSTSLKKSLDHHVQEVVA